MTFSALPYIVLAVTAGTGIGLQAIINARLGVATGSPFGAALISFLVGTAALAVVVLARGDRIMPDGPVPWWIWIGGVLGAFYIVVAAAAVPRIGPSMLLLGAIFGQVTLAFVMERIGALGVEKAPVTAAQLVGYVLVIAGFVMIRLR